MRIILVGAPDVGKRELAQKVSDLVPSHTLQLPTGYTSPNLAIGLMADYRMELHLAIERMWETRLRQNTVYTNSLIDSLSYSAYKLFLAIDYESYSYETLTKWEWTTNIIGCLLQDSFHYDGIYRLPGYSDDFGREISKSLDEILEAYNLPVIELSGDLDKDAEEIKGHINAA